ncbi:predicted protein [Verticillium alfalfae VaMs.102]|uniref:Predicted protein n=1 Tax=Verticillium alfalfae (strain VaMs.102 / ATCC MYA-4576 / FGSC 10136) TaxID=526221 RepID=C9SEQ6_VERA1|nr:predicted protein [Verticillium alfalfae VaMs.102]EEY16649.1 predicted protein [Verticillium alfalfae VaMs.102]
MGGAARASKKRLADQGSSYDARMMTVCMNGRAIWNRKRYTLAGNAEAPNPEPTNDAKPACTGSRPTLSGAGNANQEIGPNARPPAENRPVVKGPASDTSAATPLHALIRLGLAACQGQLSNQVWVRDGPAQVETWAEAHNPRNDGMIIDQWAMDKPGRSSTQQKQSVLLLARNLNG